MKRNFIWTLGIVSVLSFVSCGSDSPDKTLQKYLNFEKSCDYSSAYELLSESDKNTKSLEEYTEEEKSEFGLLFTDSVRKSTKYTIKDVSTQEKKSAIEVEIIQNDYQPLTNEVLGQAFSDAFKGADQEEMKKNLSDKMKGDISTKTTTKIYNLLKENNKWVVFFNWEIEEKINKLRNEAEEFEKNKQFDSAIEKLKEIISLDAQDKESVKKIENLEEKIKCIKNISIYDFNSQYYETYFEGNIPGITFKIKNMTSKELTLIETTVSFKDSTGTVICEEKYYPVNTNNLFGNSDSLKPNHIWQLDRGYYYKAESVPSEWQEGSAEIKVTNVEYK